MKEQNKISKDKNHTPKIELKKGEDYYINDQNQWVFTSAYHLKRGYCCRNGCKHCPYGYELQKSDKNEK